MTMKAAKPSLPGKWPRQINASIKPKLQVRRNKNKTLRCVTVAIQIGLMQQKNNPTKKTEKVTQI